MTVLVKVLDDGSEGSTTHNNDTNNGIAACPNSPSNTPSHLLLPPAHTSRPAFGRHSSSVTNLIESYIHSPTASSFFSNSKKGQRSCSEVYSPTTGAGVGAGAGTGAGSPSSPSSSSRISSRRASLQSWSGKRASTIHGGVRRPSAPDLRFPTESEEVYPCLVNDVSDEGNGGYPSTRLGLEPPRPCKEEEEDKRIGAPSSTTAVNTTTAAATTTITTTSEMSSATAVLDIKRLRSKPAPPQQLSSSSATTVAPAVTLPSGDHAVAKQLNIMTVSARHVNNHNNRNDHKLGMPLSTTESLLVQEGGNQQEVGSRCAVSSEGVNLTTIRDEGQHDTSIAHYPGHNHHHEEQSSIKNDNSSREHIAMGASQSSSSSSLLSSSTIQPSQHGGFAVNNSDNSDASDSLAWIDHVRPPFQSSRHRNSHHKDSINSSSSSSSNILNIQAPPSASASTYNPVSIANHTSSPQTPRKTRNSSLPFSPNSSSNNGDNSATDSRPSTPVLSPPSLSSSIAACSPSSPPSFRRHNTSIGGGAGSAGSATGMGVSSIFKAFDLPVSPSPRRHHSSKSVNTTASSSSSHRNSPFSAVSPPQAAQSYPHTPLRPALPPSPSRAHTFHAFNGQQSTSTWYASATAATTGSAVSSSDNNNATNDGTGGNGEIYESVLPSNSILRPSARPPVDNQSINHSSHKLMSPGNSSSTSVSSPSLFTGKNGSSAGTSSPAGRSASSYKTTASGKDGNGRKLVRKQSKGHMRKDSGTSGHSPYSATSTPVSASTSTSASVSTLSSSLSPQNMDTSGYPAMPTLMHSRSASLPRAPVSISRASTHTGGSGSGSGSERDEEQVSMSSHAYSVLTTSQSQHQDACQGERPAWLDQDPSSSLPIYNGNTATHNNAKMNSRPAPPVPYTSLLAMSSQLSLAESSINGHTTTPLPLVSASLPGTSPLSSHLQHQYQPKRKPSFYKRKRSQTASSVPAVAKSDSNGFPIPSPMSEIVKNMPLNGRRSESEAQLHTRSRLNSDALAPALPPKRSTSTGGFLSSLSKKLSHPNLKEASNFEPVNLDQSSDYFGGALSPPDRPWTASGASNNTSSPKLSSASSFTPRSWLASLAGGKDQTSTPEQSPMTKLSEGKALPQLPVPHSGKVIYEDPFSASSTLSLPAYSQHLSPRKDSLSSDRSEPTTDGRRRRSRSRTFSQDGDSSDGHCSSESGFSAMRTDDAAPPVPDLPVSMRGIASSPPSNTVFTLPKAASKKAGAILRSPSLIGKRPSTAPNTPPPSVRNKQKVQDLNFAHTSRDDTTSASSTPRPWPVEQMASNDPSHENPASRRISVIAVEKANEALATARKGGLGLTSSPRPATAASDTRLAAASKLGSFAAMDKIARIENDLREAKFMQLLDRSDKADHGIIKLSLASNAAKEAGIA